MAKENPKAEDVAMWIVAQVQTQGMLTRDEAARAVQKLFGRGFVRYSEAGNVGLSKTVMNYIHKAGDGVIVWDQGARAWKWTSK